MKNTLLLLSAVAFLTLSTSREADAQGVAEGRSVTSKIVVRNRKAQAVSPHRVIYYITNTPGTGSLIPMVYRRYNDRLDGASNAAVYGSQSIEATGTLDVATALYKLDPSFTAHR